jgi:hypothetical protein
VILMCKMVKPTASVCTGGVIGTIFTFNVFLIALLVNLSFHATPNTDLKISSQLHEFCFYLV